MIEWYQILIINHKTDFSSADTNILKSRLFDPYLKKKKIFFLNIYSCADKITWRPTWANIQHSARFKKSTGGVLWFFVGIWKKKFRFSIRSFKRLRTHDPKWMQDLKISFSRFFKNNFYTHLCTEFILKLALFWECGLRKPDSLVFLVKNIKNLFCSLKQKYGF